MQKVFCFYSWNGDFSKECNNLIEDGWTIKQMSMAGVTTYEENVSPSCQRFFYMNVLAEIHELK